MKKFLLVAALTILSSLGVSAADCALTGTLQDYMNTGSCTLTSGSYSWTLNSFLLADVTNGGSNNLGNITATDLTLSINTFANGFSLTYTMTDPENKNFFTVNASDSQDYSWRNGIWITATDSTSAIGQITNTVDGLYGGASISVKKNPQTQQGVNLLLNPLTVAHQDGGLLGPNPVSATMNFGTNLSVNDRITLESANRATGGFTAYTNTFYVAGDQGVPEPMSFVLMGAGLIGLAALRRRNG